MLKKGDGGTNPLPQTMFHIMIVFIYETLYSTQWHLLVPKGVNIMCFHSVKVLETQNPYFLVQKL